jgi:glutathione S-transferase
MLNIDSPDPIRGGEGGPVPFTEERAMLFVNLSGGKICALLRLFHLLVAFLDGCHCFNNVLQQPTQLAAGQLVVVAVWPLRHGRARTQLWSSGSNNSPFGDMAQSLFRRAASALSTTSSATMPAGFGRALEALESSSIVPSWKELRSELESQMPPSELQFRGNVPMGYGSEGSPLHKVRLFAPNNELDKVQVTFYRDSASWCPYCQKVWIALEQKQIPYVVEKINMRCYGDKPVDFLRMQPSGNIPVAKIKGKVYGQSNDILYALEEEFPENKVPLLPSDPALRSRAQQLLRLEREVFSAWLSWLTGSARSKPQFVATLQRVERELEQSPGSFFLGNEMSLVDIMFAPFLERMAASLCYYKGFVMRVPPNTETAYPHINKWFDAMETQASYRLTKSDYYTHAWDLPPQLGGCTRETDGASYEKAINGESDHWKLPLQAHLSGIEPDWSWISTEEAKRQAVERVTANFEAIVKFAARGAGSPGFPGVSAPLADPNAVPNESVIPAVDAFMRIVCAAVLRGAESQQASLEQLSSALAGGEDSQQFVQDVMSSLQYVRDRVGVPRDMTLPAARQLRAHLNWAIDGLAVAAQQQQASA